ncbi:RNA polymerase sigma factor [Paenibacillus sp. N3.4]|nr:RNA polymerase sigma factor [Paenibacillus sp. N3.4]
MTEKDLFETYKKDVYKTCYFMLQHPADAEDMCQDVFTSVFQCDWRQIEHLKTWLMRVTVNHCLNALKKSTRSQAKQRLLALNYTQGKEKAAETVVEEKESAKECQQLLSYLPGKMRAVVSLRFLNEYTLTEIADILNIPLGTVKSRLHKGLRQMKQMLEKEEKQQKKGGGKYGQGGASFFSVFRR